MADFAEFRHAVEGSDCLCLVAQEFHFADELVSPANVLFLRIEPERWLRFFLDAGAFFYREMPAVVGITEAQAAPGCHYPLAPIAAPGLVDSRVEAAELRQVPLDGARLVLRFGTGASLTLVNQVDVSRLDLSPPAA